MSEYRRKIVVGKLGQAIVFNRSSAAALRSNTNGNVGAYLFYKMLFEANPDCQFFVVGDNDLASFEKKPFDNVEDVSRWEMSGLLQICPDCGIVLIGMLNESNPQDKLLQYLNASKVAWVLAADDPRCLNTKAQDLTNLPRAIISQFCGWHEFCGKRYFVHYVPIERASCYKAQRPNGVKKTKDIVVVANIAKPYDRLKIVSDITKGLPVEVYGRVKGTEYEGDERFKGEVEFAKMQRIMQQARATLLVPVAKGWVTSKYVEAIMCDTVPIFYKDYGCDILSYASKGWAPLFVVRDAEELKSMLKYSWANGQDEEHRKAIMHLLWKNWIEPYTSGKKLSGMIMNYCLLAMVMDKGGSCHVV